MEKRYHQKGNRDDLTYQGVYAASGAVLAYKPYLCSHDMKLKNLVDVLCSLQALQDEEFIKNGIDVLISGFWGTFVIGTVKIDDFDGDCSS